jgi:2-polyprenyl-3-methyl-5-hydroxy-6-metoxy-1,4-benzoquinol methylase
MYAMKLKCSEYLQCDPENQESYARDGELEFIRCNSCGLIWRSPASVHITKAYDADYFSSKSYLRNRKHKITKSGWFIDMALQVFPGAKSLLEVGCSVGNTLEAAKIRNLHHLGIDVSRYAVDYCRSCGLNAEVKSLDTLLDEDQRFDIIYMQHVLEHFEDPFATIRQCHHLLNPQGILIILIPNAHYGRAEQQRGRHRFYSLTGVGAEHYVYFSYASLEKVLEVMGFEVLQKNYPLLVKTNPSVGFFLNRVFRKSMGLFNADQELIVLARKTKIC